MPAPGSSALRAGRLAHAHTTPYQWSGLAETGRGGRCGRANERRARGAGAYGERRPPGAGLVVAAVVPRRAWHWAQ